MKLILKGQNGFNLTNVYKSFGKGKFKKGEYYDTNGKQITHNGVLLGNVYRELRNRHDKAYVDNIASNIKAGNIYQNGSWRANVGPTAKVASEAEAIAQAKKNPNNYRQGNKGRWQYKIDNEWKYFNGNPTVENPSADRIKDKHVRYISNRSQKISPVQINNQRAYEVDPSKLDKSQYQLRANYLYDTNNRIVGTQIDNKLYAYYNSGLPAATNSEYIGKYYIDPNIMAKENGAIVDGQYRNYYDKQNRLNEYHGNMNDLPQGVISDNYGNLYDSNHKLFGKVVKTKDSTGFYKYLSSFKNGGTMKLIAKAQKGMSFKEAFNKARNNGDRIFWYKGKTYNTMSSKEKNDSKLRKQWAQTHKDNSTSGGSHSVQTDVGLSGGWKGVKGANAGRFDSNGNWVRLTEHSDAPVAARGDNVTQHLDYAPIDKPTDSIYTYINPGSDRGKGTSNLTTGVTIGMPNMVHKFLEVEPNSFADNRKYDSTQDITQFSPWGFPGGPGTYVVSPITPGYSFKNQPQEQTDNSTEYAPTTVSFKSITPEQVSAFAKSLGLKNYSIAGNKEITVTAKAKDKVKPFIENQ